MNLSRRQLLQMGGMASAAMLLQPRRAWPYLQTSVGISKFTAPLQGLGPTGIPVATADTTSFAGSDYYKIVAGEFRQVFHPDFYKIYGGNFSGTKLWGYADDVANPNHRYLGGLIIANKGRPVRLQMRNNLVDNRGNPLTHPVPVDLTVMDDLVIPQQQAALENRIAVHIHGGFVPWISDGGPFSWFGTPDPTKGGTAPTGPSKFDVPDMPTPPQGAMTFYYPNDQSARLLWYHDHAYGLTRINAYAGLATGYLLLDQFEMNLIKAGIIPDIAHLVPLVLQEKSFVPVEGNNEAGGRGDPGDLWYPSLYESNQLSIPASKGRWDIADGFTAEPTPPSCIPEFFGDTTIINGVCYPFLNVEKRHYRFMFLNGSQARFFNLQLYVSAPANDPTRNNNGTEIPLTTFTTPKGAQWLVPDLTKVSPGPKMIQIGTEGGFLPFPVALNNPPVPFTGELDSTGAPIPSTTTFNLLLAPAERADVVIDFSDLPVGTKLILYGDAPAPFPGGDPRNDYYTGDPDFTDETKNAFGLSGGAPSTQAGLGPNTRTLMQFVVGPRTTKADPPVMDLLEKIALRGLHGGFLMTPTTNMLPAIPNLIAQGKFVRRLALYEDFDPAGRLRQLIGPLTGPTAYTADAGEVVNEGDIEVWEVYNTTGDTHPLHFHLVDVRVLSRQQFAQDANGLPVLGANGLPQLLGTPQAPDNNERGQKETVRMNPGEVTRVIMKFDLPRNLPFETPLSPRLAEFGLKAHEYVWHCHILEHEEHDMMHAMSVQPKH